MKTMMDLGLQSLESHHVNSQLVMCRNCTPAAQEGGCPGMLEEGYHKRQAEHPPKVHPLLRLRLPAHSYHNVVFPLDEPIMQASVHGCCYMSFSVG
jgi:hypothetical protein